MNITDHSGNRKKKRYRLLEKLVIIVLFTSSSLHAITKLPRACFMKSNHLNMQLFHVLDHIHKHIQ